MEEPDDRIERVRGDVGDVVGGDAGVHFVGSALTPVGVERLQFHHFEADVDADFLETLLQEFVHR